eukprot:scaffold122027_cov18-Tisochrysis_lutea.AAC.1
MRSGRGQKSPARAISGGEGRVGLQVLGGSCCFDVCSGSGGVCVCVKAASCWQSSFHLLTHGKLS